MAVESLDAIMAELDSAIAETPGSFTLRADFDNLRSAIARKSMDMARLLDENEHLYKAVKQMVQAVVTYGRVHNVDPYDVEIDAMMSPDGCLRFQLGYDPWASVS